MKTMGLAFFVYIRPECTRRVIDSIKINNFKKIYIFQDGLKNEKDRSCWMEVNRMIKEIDFVETELFISEKNKGLAESIISGIDYILQRHDRVIALEDDILLGSHYREYMEKCFDFYEDNQEIMCVSGGDTGHIIPENYPYDVLFSYRMFSQAWGTWKNRWQFYKRDFGFIKSIMKNEEKRAILEKSGADIMEIAGQQLRGEVNSWAIFWVLMQIDRKGVCVLPCKELAKDIGHEGNGTNSIELSYRYDVELSEDSVEHLKLPDKVFIEKEIIEYIHKRITFPSRVTRLKSYYDLLTVWVEKLSAGKEINYFNNRNIQTIYIYGIGKIADLLLNQVKGKINIAGFVVEKKKEKKFREYPVYDIADRPELKGWPIILTPLFDAFYIEDILKKYCGADQIINIRDVIGEM